MNPKNEERIKQLAESLKSLHLVGSMEDAINRAKEIIDGTEGEEKSVKDLMESIKEVTNDIEQDVKQHEKEKEDIVKLRQEASDVKENLEDADVLLDIADDAHQNNTE